MKYMTQRYFGYTDELNDVEYLRGFVGKKWSEKLKTLKSGEFLYYHRGSVRRIRIKPYRAKTIPTLLETPQAVNILECRPIQQNGNLRAMTSIAVALIWLMAIIVALRGIM